RRSSQEPELFESGREETAADSLLRLRRLPGVLSGGSGVPPGGGPGPVGRQSLTPRRPLAPRRRLPEQLLTGRIDDGRDRRVIQPRVDGDGVELLAHALDPADDPDVVAPPKLVLEHRR